VASGYKSFENKATSSIKKEIESLQVEPQLSTMKQPSLNFNNPNASARSAFSNNSSKQLNFSSEVMQNLKLRIQQVAREVAEKENLDESVVLTFLEGGGRGQKGLSKGFSSGGAGQSNQFTFED